jgi:hypothetical protein
MVVVFTSDKRRSLRWLNDICIYICIEVFVMLGVCRYGSYV